MSAASEYNPCEFARELARVNQDAQAKATNCPSHQAAFSQVARALERCLHRHLRSHNCLNSQANESARAA
jgi:hypothetical protein